MIEGNAYYAKVISQDRKRCPFCRVVATKDGKLTHKRDCQSFGKDKR